MRGVNPTLPATEDPVGEELRHHRSRLRQWEGLRVSQPAPEQSSVLLGEPPPRGRLQHPDGVHAGLLPISNWHCRFPPAHEKVRLCSRPLRVATSETQDYRPMIPKPPSESS